MPWVALAIVGSAVIGAMAKGGSNHGSETRSSAPSARTPDQQKLWNEFMGQVGTAHQSMLNIEEAKKEAGRPMSLSIGGGTKFPFLSGTQRRQINLAGSPEDLANMSYLNLLSGITGQQENLRYGHGSQTTSASYHPSLLSSVGSGVRIGTALSNAYDSYKNGSQPTTDVPNQYYSPDNYSLYDWSTPEPYSPPQNDAYSPDNYNLYNWNSKPSNTPTPR